jgi:xylulokinase
LISRRPHAFLGIDIGTQDIHALLVNEHGRVLSRKHCPLRVHIPAKGFAEHDPDQDWWDNVCAITRQLLKSSDLEAASVEGVGVAGLFPVTCPVNSEGRPVGKAILYSDSRSQAEVEKAAQLSGQRLIGDEVIPRLLWLANYQPETFRTIHTVLSSTGYVVFKLTGRAAIDPYNAYRFGGVTDQNRLGWQRDIVAKLGLPAEIFPEISRSTQVAGGVTQQAAQASGLAPGTPVITGTTDSFAALIGSGVLESAEAMFYYGSTGWLSMVTIPLGHAIREPACLAPDAPYQLAIYLPCLGALLQWAIDLFEDLDLQMPPRDQVYSRLDAAAANIEPGAGGIFVLPYLNGRLYPQPNAEARGHITGLNLEHGIRHIWRSFLEAPGYVLAERLQDPQLQTIQRLFASGGGAHSDVWRGIISDMTGLTQYYVPEGSGALGVAFLAALGTGFAPNIDTIREKWLPQPRVTQPNPERTARYRDLLPKWQALDRSIGIHPSIAGNSKECSL